MTPIGRVSCVVLAALPFTGCRTSDCCRPQPCPAPTSTVAPDRPAPPPPPVATIPAAPPERPPASETPLVAAKGPAVIPPTDAPAAPILTLTFPESGLLSLDGSPLGRLTGAAPEEDERTLGELRGRLRRASAGPGGRNADGTSRVQLLFVGHRAAKWKFAQWVMQVCADPEVRIYKIRFLVVPKAAAEPDGNAPNGR